MPITGDLRLGGRYQLEGNAGGEIRTCDAPDHLALTWEYAGDVTWVEARLGAVEGGTRLDLEHVAHVPPQMWAEFGPGAVGVGWDSMLLGLALHTAGGSLGEGVDPTAWSMSEEGRAFMAASSERWYAANTAAGADPDEARSAADRTTAAYTAVPEDAGSPE